MFDLFNSRYTTDNRHAENTIINIERRKKTMYAVIVADYW